MRRAILILALLWPAAVLAQPTGQVITQWNDAGPFRGRVDQMPPCINGRPRIFLVTDGASSSDCATGGGAIEVPCFCLDGAYVAGGSGGGGASTLDDLTDVSTAGADPGEALVFGGATWAPSAAAVILEGDARLTDARDPTAHADSHEAGGSDPVALALDDLIDLDVTGPSSGDLLVYSDPLWTYGVPQLEDLGGELPAFKGGTGLDTSGSTGVPSIAAGTWSVGDVALGSQTSGGYAASVFEGGPATTATALAANGADCAAGQWAAGVDADGAAEGCTPDATLSGEAAGGDLAGTYPNPTIAADAVGLAELAACPGPDEIVEYGASGVPSCIATPSGGGSGDVVGPASATASTLSVFSDSTGKLLAEASGLAYSTDANYRTILSDRRLKIGVDNATNFTVITTNGTNWGLTVSASATSVYVGSSVELLRVTSVAGAPHLRTRSTGQLMWASGTDLASPGDTGIGRSSAGVVQITNGSTGIGAILFGAAIASPSTRTCTDSGDGSPGTLVATVSNVTYTPVSNLDPDGCLLTLSETGAANGQRLELIVTSSAGGTVDLNDTPPIQETGSGCSMAETGTATLRYASDRWVLTSCRPTN